MVSFCCGCAGGGGGAGCTGGGAGCCARAALAKMIAPQTVARMERNAMRDRRSWIKLRFIRAMRFDWSLIDHHAPWNAPHRNRDGRLAALRVDDGDVVAEAVGDIELALILG